MISIVIDRNIQIYYIPVLQWPLVWNAVADNLIDRRALRGMLVKRRAVIGTYERFRERMIVER